MTLPPYDDGTLAATVTKDGRHVKSRRGAQHIAPDRKLVKLENRARGAVKMDSRLPSMALGILSNIGHKSLLSAATWSKIWK